MAYCGMIDNFTDRIEHSKIQIRSPQAEGSGEAPRTASAQ